MVAKSKSTKRSANTIEPRPDKATTMQLATSQHNHAPYWPPIQTLPSSELAIEILLKDQILTISQLWTSKLCKSYVTFLKTLPLVTTPGKPKKGEAVRVNDRYQVNDARFAEQLWSCTALKDLVTQPVIDGVELDENARSELWGGDVLGLNPNIRIYRYSKGQFFDQHYDDSNNIDFPSAESPNRVAAKTTWTLLLYLTSPATGCQGGETVFYPEASSKREAAPPPVVAELEVGMALLHRHGKDCLLHEGREVTEGEKWVIRSDLVVKR
ncbi:uncharacterized protein MYCFIDRAFT_90177 [Pseudocercospora fijiensis CIRAD86]|uniref:Fe2OG dioxygenase domain-containing protein n=1 Tax=Pseudocercospora fijiensis (strain CIRAD86) TaxID=383855 RepID=M3B0D2_PSEFD|nr:uncharacterized protein MYCFIDRAFT_90177 [Pseudocercospora fijiensis CIRAD86]EME82897.1 hypothetical protein MYCFIDRAFT_90177 [Pseudocercospora fijiensis CIRAD86]